MSWEHARDSESHSPWLYFLVFPHSLGSYVIFRLPFGCACLSTPEPLAGSAVSGGERDGNLSESVGHIGCFGRLTVQLTVLSVFCVPGGRAANVTRDSPCNQVWLDCSGVREGLPLWLMRKLPTGDVSLGCYTTRWASAFQTFLAAVLVQLGSPPIFCGEPARLVLVDVAE